MVVYPQQILVDVWFQTDLSSPSKLRVISDVHCVGSALFDDNSENQCLPITQDALQIY